MVYIGSNEQRQARTHPAGRKTSACPAAFQTARLIPIESHVSVETKGVGRGGLNAPVTQYGE